MSYYILPKKNNNIQINAKTIKIQDLNNISNTSNEKLIPIVSFSLIHYLNILTEQIKDAIQINNTFTNFENKTIIENINFDLINKVTNPHEFIFTKVPGLNYSVGKLKPMNNIFYIFMELFSSFDFFNYFKENINTIHYGKNINSTIEFLNIFREDKNDVHISIELNDIEIDYYKLKNNEILNSVQNNSIDFLYFEMNNQIYNNIHKYIKGILYFFEQILLFQKKNGLCIMKLDNLFYKPILDIIYILTSLYDKIYIVKPNTTNISNNERFIVCKYFLNNETNNSQLLKKIELLLKEVIFDENKTILYIINEKLPYYFINKIEDANINIGHQQIEHLNLILNIIKNKNRDEKIETLKKANIIKCIQWCEKYKIPHNKFTDKINIFLPLKKDINDYKIYNDILEDDYDLEK